MRKNPPSEKTPTTAHAPPCYCLREIIVLSAPAAPPPPPPSAVGGSHGSRIRGLNLSQPEVKEEGAKFWQTVKELVFA